MNHDPLLRYRYADGLGDIVACTLHSKFLEPFTNFLTKSNYCTSCDNRRQALNILFPIKLWKFFYKDMDERLKSLDEEFEKINFEWNLHKINGEVQNLKYSEIYEHFNKKTSQPKEIIPPQENMEHKKNYRVISNTDVELNDLVVRTIIFERL